MDISALESLNIDVLVAILVFFALLSFVLFSIIIRLSRNIKDLKSTIEKKCNNCKVLKALDKTNSLDKENEKEDIDPLKELEYLQKGM